MRKIFYLIMLIATTVSACDPMKDTYNELDATTNAGAVVKAFSYTMVKADYDFLKARTGGIQYPATISARQSFTSPEEAGLYIPDVLNRNYPQLDNGSAITVTYNQYLYTFVNNTISNRISYTLTNSDYALGGTTFTNFDRWSQVETFLKAKYPNAKDSLVTLTYTAFNTNTNPTSKTVTDDFFFKNGQWYDTYRISPEEYTSVDRGRFNNFIAADQPMLVDYFNKFLKAKLIAPKVNDFIYVSFSNRPASTTLQEVMALRFDGTNWVKLADNTNVLVPATLKFAKKAGVWKPDLTISYNFTTADYQAIGDDPTIGTDANRANLKQFNNFYQAGSNLSDTRYWTDAQIQAGVAAHLKRLFPNAEVGQKYRATFIIYKGSNTTTVWEFEKKSSGNFEYVSVTP